MMTVSYIVFKLIEFYIGCCFSAVLVDIQSESLVPEENGALIICIVLNTSTVDRVLNFVITPTADGSATGNKEHTSDGHNMF